MLFSFNCNYGGIEHMLKFYFVGLGFFIPLNLEIYNEIGIATLILTQDLKQRKHFAA